MTLANEIPEALRSYLGLIIEEDVEKNRDHIAWLPTALTRTSPRPSWRI